MKTKIDGIRMKRWVAWILTLVLTFAIIPAERVSAAPKGLSMEDFNYYWEGEDGEYPSSFTDQDQDYGWVSALTSKNEKTYRGIKVGSKLSEVKSKYGEATKKEFDTKDSFNKYFKEYFFVYGLRISSWKSYVEYTYKKNTKNDRRLRFYLDKNDKVAAVVYIYKYKKFKLTKKKVKDIGVSFQAPTGKKITTKTIDGKKVQMLPRGAMFKYNQSKLPEYGLLGHILMYDKKNRICGSTDMPLNLNWYNGSEIESVLLYFRKCNPSTGNYLKKTNLKKLGTYKCFEFIVYDSDPKGGYDMPVRYYFRLK